MVDGYGHQEWSERDVGGERGRVDLDGGGVRGRRKEARLKSGV